MQQRRTIRSNSAKCLAGLLLALVLAVWSLSAAWAQPLVQLSGRVLDADSGEPVAGATVLVDQNGLWAICDGEGYYAITHIRTTAVTVQYSSLGYQSQTIELKLVAGENVHNVALSENNLTLEEVVVTAQHRTENQSSSYIIDRNTLEHSQLVNLNHLTTLLPGGKTVGDQNLASSSNRIALHSGATSELGHASFGTAINIDGQRLENNAVLSETKGIDLRNIGSSNIESIEIVTGIPSVEYGDLSNGMVKINTRKGHTPYIVEFTMEPKTKSVALSKGFQLGNKVGVLNTNLEHTRSISNLASPYTAYSRNNLSLTYSNTLHDSREHPIRFSASLGGNFGGYNSEADPDEFKDTYTKQRDYLLRGNLKFDWLLDRSWISSLSLQATASYSDRLNETNSNKSSASTQPYIHSTETGYYVGEVYDENPNADIILGPTGYWYLRAYTDSKPITYSFKAKADWVKRWSELYNKLLVGVEFNGSGNLGRGLYYEDMRTAPTWREYRYDELPFMNNLALFAEDKFSTPIGAHSSLSLTAGLRSDITFIKDSEYGTVANFSPRVNARYVFWENRASVISDLSIYGGWGKSVKQPSFAILYPAPTYSDRLSFAPGTTAEGKTFYAYYTQPTTPRYNPDLKWQYTIQNEIGVEATIAGTHISISAFRNKTHNPYTSRNIYTPFSYKLTTQTNIENDCTIPSENRIYVVDKQTGVVVVKDRTGAVADQKLGYKQLNTFVSQSEYTNGTAVERRGIDYVVDFAQIKPIRTQIRIDGNFYWYKGLNDQIMASVPSAMMSNGQHYRYIGYYAGGASASNGSLSKQANTNLTIITHIPKIRMIFSVRIEASFLDYNQNISEYSNGQMRGRLLADADDFVGTDETLYNKNSYVAIYPEYYTTWEDPDTKIPFLEKFLWAKENDKELYNELTRLVVKSNTGYYFNENRVSSYFAANFNLTKEIGKTASVTFYARNFFYNMGKVHSSQTGLESSLFDSGYIPKFYYGLSLRLKF